MGRWSRYISINQLQVTNVSPTSLTSPPPPQQVQLLVFLQPWVAHSSSHPPILGITASPSSKRRHSCSNIKTMEFKHVKKKKRLFCSKTNIRSCSIVQTVAQVWQLSQTTKHEYSMIFSLTYTVLPINTSRINWFSLNGKCDECMTVTWWAHSFRYHSVYYSYTEYVFPVCDLLPKQGTSSLKIKVWTLTTILHFSKIQKIEDIDG